MDDRIPSVARTLPNGPNRAPKAAPVPDAIEENPIAHDLRVVESVVVVMTGDGKGKSTAAYGTMLRALDRSQTVSVVQFCVPNDWTTGEEHLAQTLGVQWFAGRDDFDAEGLDIDGSAAYTQLAWRTAAEHLRNGTFDLVVLDDITQPLVWGWLDNTEVLGAIANRAPSTSVICTGRDAPEALVNLADTVTTMVNTKHAYQSGIAAKPGIDY